MLSDNAVIADLLRSDRENLLREWLFELGSGGKSPRGTASTDAGELLDALRDSFPRERPAPPLEDQAWETLRASLEGISRSQALQGSSAEETSHFVLSIKKPLFQRLHQRVGNDSSKLFDALWTVSALVDAMAQLTAGLYQRSREEVISRQQQELLELSTPVVKLWEGILAAPMIGTLDSNRTQLVMESLLQRIVDTGSAIAIIDITGVPTVDTLVAQHLLKTVSAIRLMGAECIISGVRPQIAQTIVHLGIDLQGVTTKATLADALAVAMKRAGFIVNRAS